ncbi:MAG: hypothetical protein AAGF15_11035 [Pseudomonadota bacterium]
MKRMVLLMSGIAMVAALAISWAAENEHASPQARKAPVAKTKADMLDGEFHFLIERNEESAEEILLQWC